MKNKQRVSKVKITIEGNPNKHKKNFLLPTTLLHPNHIKWTFSLTVSEILNPMLSTVEKAMKEHTQLGKKVTSMFIESWEL